MGCLIIGISSIPVFVVLECNVPYPIVVLQHGTSYEFPFHFFMSLALLVQTFILLCFNCLISGIIFLFLPLTIAFSSAD